MTVSLDGYDDKTSDPTAVKQGVLTDVVKITQEGTTLTAAYVGTEVIEGTITYKWVWNGEDTVISEEETYALDEGDLGKTIVVTLSFAGYEDKTASYEIPTE